MTSTLSVPQLATLETETRSLSPGTTTNPSLNKPDFTASIGPDGSVTDASTLVDRALSSKRGEMIQVSPTTSGIPREMREDLYKAKEISWNGKPVTREVVERMIEDDPEYKWEKQVSAGQKFHENLKDLGEGFLRLTFGVVGGYALWRSYKRNQRENAPVLFGNFAVCGSSWTPLYRYDADLAWLMRNRFSLASSRFIML
ncbi:hypothetical protein FFLO_05214 [Filobasidium floriforme]|uniref:Uncharacterized protein n=1 Tax=Filobasidium floriforme TaxID=5210 RepID=A0A8K0JHA1_9TREE|nr:uncharacterized protein HD553DRAFT_322762 [Filobasidium floriforme]KAG7530166.1 hypothetical protein FFLO_05214 [Filobasidium floriforme]KAH8087253.1 hypothetical protein HD553DRAFT_322762 [Filobasidium floriforme]